MNDEEGGVLEDIDPDSNFYNTHHQNTPNSPYLHIADVNSKIPKTTNSFSIFHLNIRSLSKNFKELKNVLSLLDHKFKIIALTETWAKPHNIALYNLDGYHHESLTRDGKIGGGISIYIDDKYDYKIRSDLTSSNDTSESFWIEIEKSSIGTPKNLLLGCIYRIPGHNSDSFNQTLTNTLTTISRENKITYHTGDYNLDLIKHDSHPPTNEFLNINYAHSINPKITKPTRITPTTATLIDNLFTNHEDDPSDLAGIIPLDISDHLPIFFHKLILTADQPPLPIFKRDFSAKNIKKFNILLSQLNWDPVLSSNDAQISYTSLHDLVTKTANDTFPLKQVTTNYKNKLTWLTPGLKNSIKKKHALYSHYLKIRTPQSHATYKTFKNLLSRTIRTAERNHYQTLLLSNKNNLKKSWTIIKEIINKKKSISKPTKFLLNGNETDDANQIADHFNSYFTNVGPTLDKKIPLTQTSPISFIKQKCMHNIFLNPCSESEVAKIIDKLKICASGYDNLPSVLLKENKTIFIPILTHVINLSLSQGVFPKQLKIASILPIFKAGASSSVSNYRPISLLTSISKIFERIFCTRLSAFLTKYQILYHLQFGFRPNHSTQLAMITLLEQIITSLDKGHFTIGIFLDFSKAFDTVNHQILLQKLECYGIRGIANTWVASYLSDRQQFTTYNGKKSPISNITCGVPQGSILGPILFLIYINDLGTISNKISTIMFADDSNVFSSGPNLKDIESLMNAEIPILVDWLRANRLSLNIDKTHVMVFGPPRKTLSATVDIKIEGRTLDLVKSTKFLGLILDSGLTWKQHILHLSKKIAKAIGIISLAKQTLSQKSLIQLYYSFVYPHLTYCTIIWGKSYNSTIWPVYRLQKIALRIIGNLPRRDSSKIFCKEFKLLRFPEIYILSISTFMYNYTNSLLPPTLNDLFQKNQNVHNHRTRIRDQLRAPRTHSKYAENFVSNQGVKIWNNLLTQIDVHTSLPIFKKSVKSHLLSAY